MNEHIKIIHMLPKKSEYESMVHSTKNGYFCKMCKKQFRNENSIKRHMKSIHMLPKIEGKAKK